jgi:hypothetical protein
MSLMNQYMQVLSEGKESHSVNKSTAKPGKPFFGSDVKVANDATENADIEEPKEGDYNSDDAETKPKPMKGMKESKSNPFDAFYHKILEQENWEDLAASDDTGGLEFSGDMDSGEGSVDLADPTEDIGDDMDEDMGDEDPMAEVLSALKAAVAALERVVGGDDELEDEPAEPAEPTEAGEEKEEDGEEEDEEVKEAVDAEELGHALIDLEKLASSLNNPKSQVVKGAVPVAKGKAQVPKGGKADGKPTELKKTGEELKSKKIDTKYVSNGKSWYDQ